MKIETKFAISEIRFTGFEKDFSYQELKELTALIKTL